MKIKDLLKPRNMLKHLNNDSDAYEEPEEPQVRPLGQGFYAIDTPDPHWLEKVLLKGYVEIKEGWENHDDPQPSEHFIGSGEARTLMKSEQSYLETVGAWGKISPTDVQQQVDEAIHNAIIQKTLHDIEASREGEARHEALSKASEFLQDQAEKAAQQVEAVPAWNLSLEAQAEILSDGTVSEEQLLSEWTPVADLPPATPAYWAETSEEETDEDDFDDDTVDIGTDVGEEGNSDVGDTGSSGDDGAAP